MAAEQSKEAFGCFLLVVSFRAFGYLLLCIGKILCGKLPLHTYKTFYQRLILLVLLVVSLWHRTGNDKWCAGIVNEDRVHLIDNCIIVRTLYEVFWILCHVVAQIVETELIVRSESNICKICFTTCLAVGLMLVNAIDTQTVEHIDGAHPFGVTLGKIVVDSYYMYAIAG